MLNQSGETEIARQTGPDSFNFLSFSIGEHLVEFEVVKKTQMMLCIMRPRIKQLRAFTELTLFSCVWLTVIFGKIFSDNKSYEALIFALEKQPALILFLLITPLLLYQTIKPLRKIIAPDTFHFSKKSQKIYKNKKFLCFFYDVKAIQLKEFFETEGENTFVLSLITKNETEHLIEEGNKKYIQNIANHVSGFLVIKIMKKRELND